MYIKWSKEQKISCHFLERIAFITKVATSLFNNFFWKLSFKLNIVIALLSDYLISIGYLKEAFLHSSSSLFRSDVFYLFS